MIIDPLTMPLNPTLCLSRVGVLGLYTSCYNYRLILTYCDALEILCFLDDILFYIDKH